MCVCDRALAGEEGGGQQDDPGAGRLLSRGQSRQSLGPELELGMLGQLGCTDFHVL